MKKQSFFESLTPKQKKIALSYDGDENFGEPRGPKAKTPDFESGNVGSNPAGAAKNSQSDDHG